MESEPADPLGPVLFLCTYMNDPFLSKEWIFKAAISKLSTEEFWDTAEGFFGIWT